MSVDIEKFIKDCHNVETVKKTIFDKDTYNARLDESMVGEALRTRLIEISQIYDNVSRMANHYSLLVDISEARKRVVRSLAQAVLKTQEDYKKSNAEDKKILLDTCEVEIDGEKTCLVDEDRKIAILNYMASRGRDKVKEISTVLDLGRTLLSWDKGAIGKGI
jgi:hypothetical protein